MDIAGVDFDPASAFDPELGIRLRDASQIPDIAVDPDSGALFLTWQQRNFLGLVEAVILRSIDGGLTWSTPHTVSAEGEQVQLLLPAVSVNDDGTVGVLYYDFRNDAIGQAHENVHRACSSCRLVVDQFIEEVEHGPGKGVGLVQLWAVSGLGNLHEFGPRQGCDEFSALVPDTREVELSDRYEDRNLDVREDRPGWWASRCFADR